MKGATWGEVPSDVEVGTMDEEQKPQRTVGAFVLSAALLRWSAAAGWVEPLCAVLQLGVCLRLDNPCTDVDLSHAGGCGLQDLSQ